MSLEFLSIILGVIGIAVVAGRRWWLVQHGDIPAKQEQLPIVPEAAIVDPALPFEQIAAQVVKAFNERDWSKTAELGTYALANFESKLTTELRMMISQAYFETGDFARAGEVYKPLLTATPENPEHFANVAQIEVKLGNVEHAASHLEKAVSLDATNIAYYNELAEVLRLCKRHDEAREIRQKAMELGGTTAKQS